MKKILLILLIGITYMFANVGKITAVKGEVYILRDSQKIIAKSGSILILKDQVQTKQKAKALVLFNDNTSITVGNNSKLSVNEFVLDIKSPKKSKTNFGFGKGVFRTITGKIGKINPKGFKIKTKSASIGIRGTTLDTSVSILPDGTEQVDVAFLKGHGIITNNQTGIETPVNTGQNASMKQSGETKVNNGPLKETEQMNEESQELEEEQLENEETEAAENNIDSEENEETEAAENNIDSEENEETGVSQENTSDNQTTQTETPTEDTTVEVSANTILSNVSDASETTDDTINEVNNENSQTTQIDDNLDDTIQEDTNTAPVLLSPTVTATEDTTATFTPTASDIDDDILEYSITSQPTNGTATIDSTTGEIVYIPNSNFNGRESLSVSVSDGKLSDTQAIGFDVAAINDTPVLEISSSTLELDEDTSSTLTYTVIDIEDGNEIQPTAELIWSELNP